MSGSSVASGRAGGADFPHYKQTRVSVPKKVKFVVVTFCFGYFKTIPKISKPFLKMSIINLNIS